MKTLIRNVAAATLLSAVFASSAFAMTATNQSVSAELNKFNLGINGLTVSVRDGVATLSGTAHDSAARARAAQIVRKVDGVSGVVNLVTR